MYDFIQSDIQPPGLKTAIYCLNIPHMKLLDMRCFSLPGTSMIYENVVLRFNNSLVVSL